MPEFHKPGTDNLPPGKYRETDRNGNYLSTGKTVKIDSGDRLPPTQKPNRGWRK